MATKTTLRPITPGHNVMPEIKPSTAIENRYYNTLMDIIQTIRREVDTALVREFREKAQVELAQDGISDWIAHAVDYLLDRWNARLDTLSQDVAKEFVDKTVGNFDVRFATLLRQRGFTVRVQNNEHTLNALRAVMGENVGLIKSIGIEYLGKVQQHVWQSVTGGYDLASLTQNLQHDFDVTRNRAKLIARDQSAKAHAVIEQSRRKELGITKAIWTHSHAGKQPRPSHLTAHGQEFDINKGLYLDGEWVLPGQAINCRCGSKAILPF
ncbi:phage head morphogenesis protein [Xenorhabdus stockiae]|uniref:phage head morphogenesis protein n=1 Tax=Xenorhabdus stockiae TaxID=351614 RepID=UPI004063187C